VKENRTYSIAVSGLSVGKHIFTFEINDGFFAAIEESEVQHGKLTAAVELEKKSSFLPLAVRINGNVTVACDRCLDELSVPVAFHGMPVVKFAAATQLEEMNEEKDLLWIDAGKKELDLTQYFYDSIILSLPIQRVHETEQCNKEMIEKLNKLRIN